MPSFNPGPASADTPNSIAYISTGPLQRVIAPLPLTGTVAMVNGSLGIQYFECVYPVTASRLDALYNMSYGSAATTATAANNVSVFGGIYTTFTSTNTAGTTNALSLVSSGSASTSFSFASAGSGATQLSVAGIRPLSVPVAVNMQPGEYYIGWIASTGTASVGAATTTVAFSISNLLGGSNQSAVAYGEITAATTSNSNLWGYQGAYSVTTGALPLTIAATQINQTGANQQYGQYAFVLRNY